MYHNNNAQTYFWRFISLNISFIFYFFSFRIIHSWAIIGDNALCSRCPLHEIPYTPHLAIKCVIASFHRRRRCQQPHQQQQIKRANKRSKHVPILCLSIRDKTQNFKETKVTLYVAYMVFRARVDCVDCTTFARGGWHIDYRKTVFEVNRYTTYIAGGLQTSLFLAWTILSIRRLS